MINSLSKGFQTGVHHYEMKLKSRFLVVVLANRWLRYQRKMGTSIHQIILKRSKIVIGFIGVMYSTAMDQKAKSVLREVMDKEMMLAKFMRFFKVLMVGHIEKNESEDSQQVWKTRSAPNLLGKNALEHLNPSYEIQR